jgi:hypothetical protein
MALAHKASADKRHPDGRFSSVDQGVESTKGDFT